MKSKGKYLITYRKITSKELELDPEEEAKKLKLTRIPQMHNAPIQNIYKYRQELSTDGAHTCNRNAEFFDERNMTNNEGIHFYHNPITIDLTFDDFVIDRHMKIVRKRTPYENSASKEFKPIQDIVEEIPENTIYHYTMPPCHTPPMISKRLKYNRSARNELNSSIYIKQFERKKKYENNAPFEYLAPAIKSTYPSYPGIASTPEMINFGFNGHSESTNSQYPMEPDLPYNTHGPRTTVMSRVEGYISRNSRIPSIDENYSLQPSWINSKTNIRDDVNHFEPSKKNKSMVMNSIVGQSGTVTEIHDGTLLSEATTKFMNQHPHIFRQHQPHAEFPLGNSSNKMPIFENPHYQLPDNMPFKYSAYPGRSRISSPYDPGPYERPSPREMDKSGSSFQTANLQFWDGPEVQDDIYDYGQSRRRMSHLEYIFRNSITPTIGKMD